MLLAPPSKLFPDDDTEAQPVVLGGQVCSEHQKRSTGSASVAESRNYTTRGLGVRDPQGSTIERTPRATIIERGPQSALIGAGVPVHRSSKLVHEHCVRQLRRNSVSDQLLVLSAATLTELEVIRKEL
jgi:hypothetical protein